MDLTSLTIGMLTGGIAGASLAAIVMGGLAREKQIDERQEETRHAVGGLDADGTGEGGASGNLGGNRVHGADGGNYLRDLEPGAAAEIAALTREVWQLRIDRSNLRLALQWECEETARLRGLLGLPATEVAERVDPAVVLCLGELADEQERQEAERRLAREGRAWASPQGPDVASLGRVNGGAT